MEIRRRRRSSAQNQDEKYDACANLGTLFIVPSACSSGIRKIVKDHTCLSVAGSCAFVMPGFMCTVRNHEGTSVLKIYSLPSCKHYRTSSTILEQKYDYADIEHVCCRAVHLNDKDKYEPFEFSKKINDVKNQVPIRRYQTMPPCDLKK